MEQNQKTKILTYSISFIGHIFIVIPLSIIALMDIEDVFPKNIQMWIVIPFSILAIFVILYGSIKIAKLMLKNGEFGVSS